MVKKQTTIESLARLHGSELGLVDRDRETKQLLYALLTKEHLLLMGPAGTAKSQFAVNALSMVRESSLFQIHLTKQTTEEYVFGPLNIIELKKGNLVHNTKDSILTADFAFLDEFFDASDVLLRSLLGILNERVWMKGSQQAITPLHTAILTSNYQRENEVTQAVLDRIIFKCEVSPSTAKSKRIKIYKEFLDQPDFEPVQICSLKELQKLSSLVESPNAVKIPKEILETYDHLLSEFIKETKKYISPRTANKALKVLKAAALLDKRVEVGYEDMEELRYVFCTLNDKMEEEIFDATYDRCVGKAEEEKTVQTDLGEMEIKIGQIPTSFDNFKDEEFINKMRELNEYIHVLEQMNCPTDDTKAKKERLLSNIRSIIEDNRDILFKRKNNVTPTSVSTAT